MSLAPTPPPPRPQAKPIIPASPRTQPVKGPVRNEYVQMREDIASGKTTYEGPKENEAVSFLKMPFVGQKSTSENIPSTSLADVGQFVPLGVGAGKAAKGIDALGNIIKSESKTTVKTGSADIGLSLNEKTSKQINEQKAKDQFDLFNRNVQAIKNKGPVVYQTRQSKEFLKEPVNSPFKETNANLGKGTGKIFYESPSGKKYFPAEGPAFKGKTGKEFLDTIPQYGKKIDTRDIHSTKEYKAHRDEMNRLMGGKEVQVGKGLVQKIKQEPKIKPLVQKPTFKEYPISLGKSKVQIVRPKVLPKQITVFKEKQKQKQTQENKQEQKLRSLFGTETKQKQPQPYLSIPKQGQPQRIIPKQKQPQIPRSKIPIPFIPVFRPTPPPPKQPPVKIPKPNPKKPPESSRRRPPPFTILTGKGVSPRSILGKGGSAKNYIGNVPENSFTGMYNRSETTYGNPKTPKSTSKSLSRKFKSLI